MALPLVIANCVQVRLLWSIHSQLGVNVLHGIVPSGFVVNQAVVNTLGSAIKSAFTAQLAIWCPPTTSLVRVGLRDLRQANQTEYLDTGAAVPGVSVGEGLPGSVAMCITLRTALSGKSHRGRVYLGGFSEEANLTTGTADPSSTTQALAFMTSVDTAFDSSQITLAVASRPAEAYVVTKTINHNDGSTTTETIERGNARAGSAQPVTAMQSRAAIWESQRRRGNGRGVGPTVFTAGSIVQSQGSVRNDSQAA